MNSKDTIDFYKEMQVQGSVLKDLGATSKIAQSAVLKAINMNPSIQRSQRELSKVLSSSVKSAINATSLSNTMSGFAQIIARQQDLANLMQPMASAFSSALPKDYYQSAISSLVNNANAIQATAKLMESVASLYPGIKDLNEVLASRTEEILKRDSATFDRPSDMGIHIYKELNEKHEELSKEEVIELRVIDTLETEEDISNLNKFISSLQSNPLLLGIVLMIVGYCFGWLTDSLPTLIRFAVVGLGLVGCVVAPGLTKVRKEPSTSSETVIKLKKGTNITIIGEVPYYYKVSVINQNGDTVEGYIAKKNIILYKNI